MHKKVSEARDGRRHRSRLQNRFQAPNFAEGDFVLFGVRQDSPRVRRSKLSVRWTGPYSISAVLSSWHFRIQHIVNGECLEAHVTRLKFYHDRSLLVTEELTQYASSNIRFIVHELLDVRFENDQWQVWVSWAGFSADENTWEPVQQLLEDVPSLVQEFVRSRIDDHDVRRMSDSLTII
jgi:hypothetical protein